MASMGSSNFDSMTLSLSEVLLQLVVLPSNGWLEGCTILTVCHWDG